MVHRPTHCPPISPTPSYGMNIQIGCYAVWVVHLAGVLQRPPHTISAVRFDNAEHLPLSPPAKSKRGDLSPLFICNVMSMYSLLVTELEKMVDPTVWENPWGFSGDQGTLSWQLEPKKTSFSLRCQSWRFWNMSPESWEEISIWVHIGLKAIWVSWILLYRLCVRVGTNSEERYKWGPNPDMQR